MEEKNSEFCMYVCPKCSKENWRNSHFKSPSVCCDWCHSLFYPAPVANRASPISLLKEANRNWRQRVTRIGDMCAPKDMYVYEDFCVFNFSSVLAADILFDMKTSRKPLFQNLEVNQRGVEVVMIDRT